MHLPLPLLDDPHSLARATRAGCPLKIWVVSTLLTKHGARVRSGGSGTPRWPRRHSRAPPSGSLDQPHWIWGTAGLLRHGCAHRPCCLRPALIAFQLIHVEGAQDLSEAPGRPGCVPIHLPTNGSLSAYYYRGRRATLTPTVPQPLKYTPNQRVCLRPESPHLDRPARSHDVFRRQHLHGACGIVPRLPFSPLFSSLPTLRSSLYT